ncbi:MAG: glycogen synthase GlgA [Eubacteriales bacterium]|nr:glycogen synthase GlgA [Eubacteriales bacterium]
MKNILFAASECVPFIKTGGLADVVGALPKSIDKEKYDVRVVIPDYTCIPVEYRNRFTYFGNFYMDLGDVGNYYVGIMTCQIDGVQYYFIDNEHYFHGTKPYSDLLWDIQKFCFFSKAVLSMLPVIGFHPDIIHCHDWQAGLIPVFLHEMFKDNPFYHGIRTIMTIHNLKFQGVWDIPTLIRFTGLPRHIFTPDRLEFKKDANMLKGGLVYADRITTVSNTYAEEIRMPYYGEGLDGLLNARSDSLWGILNGIDYDAYNPKTDEHIAKKYTARTYRKGKLENKLALQRELGMPEDPEIMMLAMITRLTDQKGLDLVEWVIDRLLQSRIQLVIIGTGDPRYENLFRHYEWTRKGQVSSNILFNETRAHRLYAAADAMLMPSRFEPCGLTQLISLRYGTVPIVRETGGLRDTVEPYNCYEQTGTGFSFANYNADEMLDTIYYAEKVFYEQPKEWAGIVRRGMEKDFSWNSSAKKYEELYESLVGE